MTKANSTTWKIDTTTRAEIDALFADYTNRTPGCAVAIYRDGEIEYANGYGMSNLEHNVPITPGSIFHVASISKQFTAMCIALLQQDGLLNVDDSVRDYIPELPEYDHKIVIRHLIHHVSGLRDQWMLLRLAGWRQDDLVTEDDCFELIRRQDELNFTPNETYMYSNSGYTLLAKIVKHVSGKSLREFAHERIFTPLGMMSTHFHDDHSEMVPGRTQAYQRRPDGTYAVSIPVFDVVGTTSLFTTVEDFARWNHNFATGEVGGDALLDLVQTPGVFNNGSEMEYAWGLTVDTWRGARKIGHDGADHGYRSSYFRLPEHGFGVTVFANLASISPASLAEKIAEVVLGSRIDAASQEASSESHDTLPEPISCEVSSIAGVYLHDDTENNQTMVLHIRLANDVAEIVTWDSTIPLVKNEDGSFSFHNGLAKLLVTELTTDGLAHQISFRMPGSEATTYERVDDSAFGDRPLSDFTGEYTSPELQVQVSLESGDEENALTWQQHKLGSATLVRVGPTTFGLGSLGGSMMLEFAFPNDGESGEFRLSGSRLRNLRYVRQR